MSRRGARGDRLLVLLGGVLFVGAVGASCRAPQPAESADSFMAAVESAHGRAAWSARRALQGRVSLNFGGTPALAARILFRTDLGASRLELDDGTLAVFDGKYRRWAAGAPSSVGLGPMGA